MASAQGGRIVWNLDVETGKFSAGLSKASQQAKQIGGEVEKQSSGISTKMGALIGVFAGIAQRVTSTAISTITGLVSNAVSRVDTLNNFPKVMANLGYSTEESAKAMKKLDAGVKGLPTSLDGIASAMQNIAPASKSMDYATDLTLALNNALLAGGKSMDLQNSAMQQFSQAFAKGKPDMMEWRSLATAMPGQLDQIAKKLGFTKGGWIEMAQAVTDGKIKFSDVTDAIIDLNKKGLGNLPSFAEQAKNATGGLATGVANAKTAITRGIANIIQAIGSKDISKAIGSIGTAFEKLMKVVTNMIKGLKQALPKALEFLSPKFERLGRIIAKDLMPALKNLYEKAIKPLLPILGTTLVVALGLVIDGLSLLIKAFSKITDWIVNNKPVFYILIALFAGLVLDKAYNSALNYARMLGKDFIPAIKKAATAVKGFNGTVSTALGAGALITFAVLVGNEIKKVGEATMKTLDETNEAIRKNADAEDVATQRVLQAYRDKKISREQLNKYMKSMNEDESRNLVKETGTWEMIWGGFIYGLKSKVNDLKEKLKVNWSDIANSLSVGLNNMGQKLAGWGNTIHFGLNNIFSTIAGTIWNTLWNISTMPLRLAGNIASNLWNFGWHGINAVIGWTNQIKGTLWNALWDLVSQPWKLAGHIASSMWNFGNSAWNAFKRAIGMRSPSYFSKAFFAIRDDAKDSLKKMNSYVNEMAHLDYGSAISGSLGSSNLGNSTSNSTANFYGNITLQDKSAVDEFFTKLNRNSELAQKGMATL